MVTDYLNWCDVNRNDAVIHGMLMRVARSRESRITSSLTVLSLRSQTGSNADTQRRINFCVEALLYVRVLIEMSVEIDRIMGEKEDFRRAEGISSHPKPEGKASLAQ